jgi:hypothetical protein
MLIMVVRCLCSNIANLDSDIRPKNLISKIISKTESDAMSCNPSTQDAEARESRVQG